MNWETMYSFCASSVLWNPTKELIWLSYSGPWESLTNELERAYQSILDVTQVYFATILIDGDSPHRPPKYFLAGHSGGELR